MTVPGAAFFASSKAANKAEPEELPMRTPSFSAASFTI